MKAVLTRITRIEFEGRVFEQVVKESVEVVKIYNHAPTKFDFDVVNKKGRDIPVMDLAEVTKEPKQNETAKPHHRM